MTTDATAQLIQRILGQLSQDGANAQAFSTSILDQVDSTVATAANYAGILSAVEGPIVQAAVAPLVGNIASEAFTASAAAGAAPGASAQAAALALEAQGQIAGDAAAATVLTTAAATGVGVAIVLIVAFFLADLAASNQSGSTEAQQLAQLNNEIQDIQDVDLSIYWKAFLQGIVSFWNSPEGGLGTDLDNLANEGIGVQATDVHNDVDKFHDNAMAFVDNLIPSKTPGAESNWERPIVQTQLFSAQQVPYPAPVEEGTPGDAPIAIGSIMGWYGTLPRPLPGPSLGGSAEQMALDPRSALPFLLLGLRSYLTIEALVNFINPNQPTFSDFLTAFNGDLQDYATFLSAQYTLAVNGIIKSDIPKQTDISSFLYFIAEVVQGASFADNTQWWQGSLPCPAAPGSWPFAGFAWNGVYGVVDDYPQYGAYQSSPPVTVPSSSPAYLIDMINTDDLVSEVTQAVTLFGFQYIDLQRELFARWVLPWVQNKLILGVMARWKAIFLINGYDKVWSILQTLRVLANQSLLPTLTLDQDGTIANGNWSARELCTVLNVDGNIFDGVPNAFTGLTTVWSGDAVPRGPAIEGYSLFSLAECLDKIANGNWAGPPGSLPPGSLSPPGNGATRPLGFRDRLAAAAI